VQPEKLVERVVKFPPLIVASTISVQLMPSRESVSNTLHRTAMELSRLDLLTSNASITSCLDATAVFAHITNANSSNNHNQNASEGTASLTHPSSAASPQPNTMICQDQPSTLLTNMQGDKKSSAGPSGLHYCEFELPSSL
jgi:hypothetical protein